MRTRPVVEGAVELLGRLAVESSDEEDRPRCDVVDEVDEAGRWRLAGKDRHGGGLGEQRRERLLQVAQRRVVPVLGDRADAGALGDDGAQPGVLRGGLEQHLAADGEPEAADALRVHVRAAGEEVDRGLQVGVAAPAVGVEVAVALAFAAPIEQQHAVSVPREQPGVGERAAAPGGERRSPRRSRRARTTP